MEIKRFLRAIIRKIWVVLLLTALGGGGMFYFGYINSNQLYEATTTLLTVTTGDNSGNAVNQGNHLTYNDIQLGRQFDQDFQDIMLSEKVVGDTGELLKDKGITKEEIYAAISLTSQKDSSIIRISAVSKEPERAVLISDAVSNAFINRINVITQNNIFGIISKAKEPLNPIPTDTAKKTAMGFVTGLVLALVTIYITEIFDTRIRYTDDIEFNSNLKVLASIPKYTGK